MGIETTDFCCGRTQVDLCRKCGRKFVPEVVAKPQVSKAKILLAYLLTEHGEDEMVSERGRISAEGERLIRQALEDKDFYPVSPRFRDFMLLYGYAEP